MFHNKMFFSKRKPNKMEGLKAEVCKVQTENNMFLLAVAESQNSSGGRDLWRLSSPTTCSEEQIKVIPGTGNHWETISSHGSIN